MSVEHIAAALHHSRARGTARLVLIGIANHAGDGGAYPSMATLAKYANVTPRNAQKAVQVLVGLGEVRVLVAMGGDAKCPDWKRPNLYEVLVTCPAWCDRTPQHRDTRKGAAPQPGFTLGLEGASEPTPGVECDRGRVSLPTPLPLSDPTPKPSLEPSTNPLPSVVPQLQDARARTDPCGLCGAPSRLVCEDRQRRVRPEDRHDYQALRHATG